MELLPDLLSAKMQVEFAERPLEEHTRVEEYLKGKIKIGVDNGGDNYEVHLSVSEKTFDISAKKFGDKKTVNVSLDKKLMTNFLLIVEGLEFEKDMLSCVYIEEGNGEEKKMEAYVLGLVCYSIYIGGNPLYKNIKNTLDLQMMYYLDIMMMWGYADDPNLIISCAMGWSRIWREIIYSKISQDVYPVQIVYLTIHDAVEILISPIWSSKMAVFALFSKVHLLEKALASTA